VGGGGGGWGPGCGRKANFPTPARRALAGGGSPVAGFGVEGVPFRECFFVSLRATRKQPTPTLIKKKKSEWGRASPTPVRLPPATGPPARPPARRLARRSFAPSSPSPGSRARGGAEKRIEERFGNLMGLGLGGRGSFLATLILPLPRGSDPPASSFLPRSLSLPRTFPGQLGLKFSGEAPRARGIRGGSAPPRTPPELPPRLPRLATGRVTPRGGGGGDGGAAEPRAGGERGPAWAPSSAPTGGWEGGGEGLLLILCEAARPGPGEARLHQAGSWARLVLGPLGFPPWGRGLRPSL
jgi:hypothetical protein